MLLRKTMKRLKVTSLTSFRKRVSSKSHPAKCLLPEIFTREALRLLQKNETARQLWNCAFHSNHEPHERCQAEVQYFYKRELPWILISPRRDLDGIDLQFSCAWKIPYWFEKVRVPTLNIPLCSRFTWFEFRTGDISGIVLVRERLECEYALDWKL